MNFKTTLHLLIILCLFSACGPNSKSLKDENETNESVQNELERIKNSGVLRAVVDYNSTNYFVYKGKPMGFKYELLHVLCKELDVKPEIYVSNNLKETFEGLKEDRFDVVAKNLTITINRTNEIDFTVPLEQTSQVLVQRKNTENSKTPNVKSTLDLIGKRIHVQKNTTYFRRLQHLSEEIGSSIEIVQDSIFGVEQLISLVAEGKIDHTVCDENVAKLNQTYYPDLDISLKISFPQNLAWAVKKGASEWKEFLDNWIVEYKKTKEYKQLYHKYFESSRIAERRDSEFHSISGGKISKFDKTIKKLSVEHGWDWRIIASMIYHESRFNPDAGSWAGAYGLMQLLPSTAESFGIIDFEKPEQNIKAGILFLNWLDKQFMEEMPDSTERIKFVLASYNIGLGHVKDAQRLAEKYGKNKLLWDNNVAFYLRNKSSEKYFKDPVTRFGYCRGEEAFNYVNRVLTNYEHYQNVISK